MFYDSVLNYVRTVLKNDHIPSTILTEPYENIEMLDLGLRESLFQNFDKEGLFRIFTEMCEENTLYYCTDDYYCSYVVMRLPNPDIKQYFFVGPFTYAEITQKSFLSLIEKLNTPAVRSGRLFCQHHRGQSLGPSPRAGVCFRPGAVLPPTHEHQGFRRTV